MAVPSDISGLTAWLKADAITGKVNSDPISTWSDSSGNGNNAIQATAGNQPLYKTSILNGKPVLRFDGIDDWLTMTLSPVNPFSILVVYCARLADSSGRRAIAGSANWLLGPYANEHRLFQGAFASGTQASVSAGTFVVNVTLSTSTTATHYVNGTSRGTISSPTTPGTVRIGASEHNGVGTFTEHLDGDIAEVIIYNKALTTGELSQIDSYIQDKYAITVSDYVASSIGTITDKFFQFF